MGNRKVLLLAGGFLAAALVVGLYWVFRISKPPLPGVAEAEALGATVTIDEGKPTRAVVAVSFADTQVTDDDLRCLRSFPHLQDLSLCHTPVTDKGMEQVRGLTTLRSLNLSHTAITDLGLAQLRDLARLRELSLNQTRITDAAVEHLKALASLQELELIGTAMSSQGIEALQEALPQTRILH